MSTAYNGRIDAANREGRNLKIAWTGGIYDLDYWVIPKGTPNKDAALKFIAFASTPDAQAEYATNIAYGPTNTKALAKLDRQTLGNLPTAPANAKDARAVQHQVLGGPGRGTGEALRVLGGAIGLMSALSPPRCPASPTLAACNARSRVPNGGGSCAPSH